MSKRRAIHEAKAGAGRSDDLKVGDIITVGDILGTDPSVAAQLPPPGWSRGEASPFPFDVFDCRAVALTSMSMTVDPDVADSFSRLRGSDGTEYIGAWPEDPVRMDIDLPIDLHGYEVREGPLFKARQMEDKWDIYHYGEFYYFVRSWTGALVHVARGHVHGGKLNLSSFVTASERVDERDRTFFVREVFFLMVSHVLGAAYAHPVPSYRADTEESILAFSFSEFGRRGWYGVVAGG